jgi:hypothetical protein
MACYFKTPAHSVPLLTYHGSQICQTPLKTEILARQFEQSYHLTLNMGSNTHSLTVTRHINRFFRSTSPQTPPQELTNHYEVRRKILSLTTRGPGDNGITSVMLRHLSLKALIYLTRLFNHLLCREHFPHAWKRAKVNPILKPNKPPTDPNSYRPISLLSIVGKLFERIIASRLSTQFNQKHLLPDEQFGFRKKTLHRLSTCSDHRLHLKWLQPPQTYPPVLT